NISNNRISSGGVGVSVSDLGMDVTLSANVINSGDIGIGLERVQGNGQAGGTSEAEGDQISAHNIGLYIGEVSGSVSAQHERLADFSAWGIQIYAYSGRVDVLDIEATSSSVGSGGIYVSNLNTTKAVKTRSNIQNNRIITETTGIWIEQLQDDLEVSGNEITVDDGTGMLLTNFY